MAQPPPVPLDEIQYKHDGIIAWHVNDNGGQAMDEDMIYRYIDESPFMDSSKNAVYMGQSRANMQQYLRSLKRKDFEDDMKAAKGVEYMITQDPQPIPAAPGVPAVKVEKGVGGNGMWVIRKQDRLRVGGKGDQGDVAVMGTYWINGQFMYQAPSVGDVIGCRLITAANHLSKLYETASKLPTFDPERGYYYLPASANTQKATSTTASAAGTPSRSREGSIAAGGDSQSLRSNSLLPDSTHSASLKGQDYKQAVLLADSFRSTLEFADDFMDENPLVGEPGNFTYTHSTAAVKKRRADAEAELAALAAAAKAKESQLNSKVATPAGKPPSPPAVMTEKAASAVKDVKEREKERRGSKLDRKGKRKRQSVAPSTPLSAGTSSAPGSAI